MNLKTKQPNKKVVLIFSSFFPVGLEDYLTFFSSYFEELYYLRLKFPHSKDPNANSCLEHFLGGSLVAEKKLFSLRSQKNLLYFFSLPINYFLYLWQIISNLWRIKKDTRKTVIFMGINYFCAFGGIILKKLGRVDYVVYRVMDFFPLPPSGPYRLLNRIFYIFDRYCLKNSDFIWFTTEGHIVGREKYGYFDRKRHDYELLPLAINAEKFKLHGEVLHKFNHTLIYCGVVSRYHQLDLVFEAIKQIKERMPLVKLELIGSGPDVDYFKSLAKKLNIEKNIIFHGFMDEGEEFFRLMSSADLGIALYKDEENFMKYTEPAKVKYYLNFGVPAIISRVPKIASELDQKGVSFAVRNEPKEIAQTIELYFGNEKMRRQTHEKIRQYIPTIEVGRLLETKFDKLLKKI